MLNAVSSGRRLTNVTPVRDGDSCSKSCGSRARPQPARASTARKIAGPPRGGAEGRSLRLGTPDSHPAPPLASSPPGPPLGPLLHGAYVAEPGLSARVI